MPNSITAQMENMCYLLMDTCLFTPTQGVLGSKRSHVSTAHLPASMGIEGISTTEIGGGIFQIAMESFEYAAHQLFRELMLTTEGVYGREKEESKCRKLEICCLK